MFALLASPRRCFTVFNKRFSNRVRHFCLAIPSATSYDACLLGGNFWQDKSLTFQTRFMALEEFYNFLWRDWYALSLKCPYQFRRFHILSSESLYFTAGRFIGNVERNFTR